MWMAIVRERQNNLEAADGLYQSALAAEDPNSAAAATITELYAQLLQKQGRTDEAAAMRTQASTIRKSRPRKRPQWASRPVRMFTALVET